MPIIDWAFVAARAQLLWISRVERVNAIRPHLTLKCWRRLLLICFDRRVCRLWARLASNLLLLRWRLRRLLCLLGWWLALQPTRYEVERGGSTRRLWCRRTVLLRIRRSVRRLLRLCWRLRRCWRVETLDVLLGWQMLLALRSERLLWRIALRGGRSLRWVALLRWALLTVWMLLSRVLLWWWTSTDWILLLVLRLRHARLKERLIVSTGFDKLLVQLCKVICGAG